jgi:hypothetical protein
VRPGRSGCAAAGALRRRRSGRAARETPDRQRVGAGRSAAGLGSASESSGMPEVLVPCGRPFGRNGTSGPIRPVALLQKGLNADLGPEPPESRRNGINPALTAFRPDSVTKIKRIRNP